ncbi:hypothetical protein BDV96DRAFT_595340 [Lophiotrema nucula]|uniref:Uncharacterized protein n=1 Tax=Lophiotrema nucula TaxID=690887 RepID=A0A6A5ZPY3_9PLEO|nr:hypothetical protein BDV96DRAFT_595340 [Lophiotrema nucula]
MGVQPSAGMTAVVHLEASTDPRLLFSGHNRRGQRGFDGSTFGRMPGIAAVRNATTILCRTSRQKNKTEDGRQNAMERGARSPLPAGLRPADRQQPSLRRELRKTFATLC